MTELLDKLTDPEVLGALTTLMTALSGVLALLFRKERKQKDAIIRGVESLPPAEKKAAAEGIKRQATAEGVEPWVKESVQKATKRFNPGDVGGGA